MKWKEVKGKAVCVCPPTCDGCDRVRTCLDVGVPLPKERADNANLKAAVRGKTFYHSDEAVMQELGTLRAKLTQVEQDRDRLAAEADNLRKTLMVVRGLDPESPMTFGGRTFAEWSMIVGERDELRERVGMLDDALGKTEAALASAQQSAQEQIREGMEWALRWVKANWSSDWGKTICGMEDAIQTELSKGEGNE